MDPASSSATITAITSLNDPRVQELSHAVLQAVLDGDFENARAAAEELRRLHGNAIASSSHTLPGVAAGRPPR